MRCVTRTAALLVVSLAVAGFAQSALGGVSLRFDDGVSDPVSGTYFVGNVITVDVKMDITDNATADQVNNVAYFLKANIGGLVTIQSRDSSGSPFDLADAFPTDGAIAGTVLQTSGTTNMNEGFTSTSQFVTGPVTPGLTTYEVAKFKFISNTANTYVISFDPSKAAEVYTTPSLGDQAYAISTSTASYTAIVAVPEPASLGGVILLLGSFARRRNVR